MRNRSRRRSRRNAFFGHPLLHRWAAKRGHRRSRRGSRRRTRRNAGTLSGVSRSIGSGFHLPIMKRAAVIIGGNISTTWSTGQLLNFLPTNNDWLKIVALLGMAGVNGFAASKFSLTRRYANDIFIGGVLAGANKLAQKLLPGAFYTCGLSEDLDGFSGMGYGGGPVGPSTYMYPFGTSGVGSYAHLGQPIRQGTSGLDDYGQPSQVHPTLLDGLANAEVEREIAGLM